MPPWEYPDNPDQFVIEPRGDSTLALADMMTRDTFDKTIDLLGTGKASGLDGIPNEIIKFLPLATRSALFSLLSLNGATAPPTYYIKKVIRPSSTTTAPSPS
jgi:hypothetical protein